MRVIIDSVNYPSKPEERIVPSLITRLTKGHKRLEQDVSVEQLIEKIEKGHTWLACTLKPVDGIVKKKNINWASQQIICLDFDNEKSVPNPDFPHKSKKKKIKIKHVTWTLERAIEEFKNTAMFIYPSFNYKEDHPKFRVVFSLEKKVDNYAVFDQIIRYLMKKYPEVDEGCKDGARLWFGTNSKVIPLNFNNRLDISDIGIDFEKVYTFYDNTKIKNNNSQQSYHNISEKLPITEYIMNNDVDSLKQYMSNLKDVEEYETIQIFSNVNDVYKFINNQDMRKFLGVNAYQKFRCVFHDHEDLNPSASIFTGGNDPDNPVWLYRCHCMGENANEKMIVYNLVQLVEKISEWDTVRTRNFLMKVYDLKFEESEWAKTQKEILDENIRRLYDYMDEWAESFPNFYGIIKKHNYKDKLKEILWFARDHISTETFTDNETGLPLFWLTAAQANKLFGYKEGKLGVPHGKVFKMQSMFAFLRLLNRVEESNIPEFILNNAKIASGEHKFYSSFYSIPSYSTSHLVITESKAKMMKDSNANLNTFTVEGVHLTFGDVEAKRCFPQAREKGISELTEKFYESLKGAVGHMLKHRGYVTEQDALLMAEYRSSMFVKKNGELMKQPPSKKSLFAKTFPSVIQYYSLEKVKATKVFKEKFNIISDGYPMIYVPTNYRTKN